MIQLWPEHFDIAVDLGDTAAGGAPTSAPPPATPSTPSPTSTSARGTGRDLPESPDSYWNEPFGASLPYSALVGGGSGAPGSGVGLLPCGTRET